MQPYLLSEARTVRVASNHEPKGTNKEMEPGGDAPRDQRSPRPPPPASLGLPRFGGSPHAPTRPPDDPPARALPSRLLSLGHLPPAPTHPAW